MLIEKAIEEGWIGIVNVSVNDKFIKAAKVAGLHRAEITIVYHAYKNGITALLDEDAARVFCKRIGR